MTTSPRRFKDAPEILPEALSRALHAAPTGPTSADLRELATTLGSSLGIALQAPPALPLAVAKALPHVASAGSTSSSIAAGTLGVWVLGGMGLGLGLSGVVAFTAAALDSPRLEPVAVPASARPALSRSDAPQTTTRTAQQTEPVPAAPSAKPRAPSVGQGGTPANAPSSLGGVSPSTPSESELSLLRRAQAALAVAPERALDLVRAHQERYGEGLLAQEREVIAIEALVRRGRVPEAAQRARAFSLRYPGSAHQRRIDRLFASATSTEP